LNKSKANKRLRGYDIIKEIANILLFGSIIAIGILFFFLEIKIPFLNPKILTWAVRKNSLLFTAVSYSEKEGFGRGGEGRREDPSERNSSTRLEKRE